MKQLIKDRVHFKFPRDKELMMAASATFQAYVNSYDAKMAANDVSGGRAQFKLYYTVDIAPEDWDLLGRLKLKLEYLPMKVAAGQIDMYVDWSDERIDSYKGIKKHAVQACGIMSGEESAPIPVIRRYKSDLSGNGVWACQKEEFLSLVPNGKVVDLDTLLATEDGVYCCYVGYAGLETYVASSLGMPVIEIIPADRPVKWLSKFVNTGYRVVIDNGDVERQIRAAVFSIEELVEALRDKTVQIHTQIEM